MLKSKGLKPCCGVEFQRTLFGGGIAKSESDGFVVPEPVDTWSSASGPPRLPEGKSGKADVQR
jgi:hypothetical protein